MAIHISPLRGDTSTSIPNPEWVRNVNSHRWNLWNYLKHQLKTLLYVHDLAKVLTQWSSFLTKTITTGIVYIIPSPIHALKLCLLISNTENGWNWSFCFPRFMFHRFHLWLFTFNPFGVTHLKFLTPTGWNVNSHRWNLWNYLKHQLNTLLYVCELAKVLLKKKIGYVGWIKLRCSTLHSLKLMALFCHLGTIHGFYLSAWFYYIYKVGIHAIDFQKNQSDQTWQVFETCQVF
jgi:hypothetical protein